MGKLGNPMAIAAVANSITPTQKKIIIIGGVAIAGILTYALIQNYRRFWKGNNMDSEKGIVETLDTIVIDNNKTTIDNATAMNLAQQLFDSMNRAGTDNTTVFRIIEGIKSKHDFYLIWKAFGVKYYGRYGESFIKNDLVASPLDLIGWLKKELGSNEQNRLRNTFNRLGIVF